MNTKVKKGLFWGVIAASIIFVINILHHLFGGQDHGWKGPQGNRQGGMGQESGFGNRGGFEAHQIMHGYHHDGGLHWLGFLFTLIIGIVIVLFLVRWLRRKAKTSSMSQLIDIPHVELQTPSVNHNGNILDQWEKNLLNKKENE